MNKLQEAMNPQLALMVAMNQHLMKQNIQLMSELNEAKRIYGNIPKQVREVAKKELVHFNQLLTEVREVYTDVKRIKAQING